MADAVAPVDPKVDFVAGTAAGVASLLVGHPFDTSTYTVFRTSYKHRASVRRRILRMRFISVKVRLQCQKDGMYRNSVHAFHSIVQQEKVRSRAVFGDIPS